MNLVSMTLQYLAPALVGKLASNLGINPNLANTVIKAAVPVILAALAGKAAKADGARALTEALTKQDTGMLGRLSQVLGGPQHKAIAEQGTTALGGLIGNTSLGTLIGTLSRFTGSSEKATGGLVGILAPIVMGTLAQQQKSMKLEAGGVAKLLAEQKPNIAAAIPGELAKMLAGTNLLDGVLPGNAGVASPGAALASPAKPFNGWPWAVLVGAASLIWGAWFGGAPAPWADVPAPPRLMAGSTDVAGELDGALRSLHGVLSGVTDTATAEAGIPRLRLAQSTLERLDGAARQLSSDNRQMLANHVGAWLPVIAPAVTRLLANASIAPLVKPVLETTTARLASLAKG